MASTLSVQHTSKQPVEYSKAKTSISCSICSSLYEPAPAHSYLLQSPQLALEAAFMSMCHFCFRCRRPACPNCWDEIHGLCGTCVVAVNLTFRQEIDTSPLNGILPVPIASTSIQQASAFPLRCVEPGRFQQKEQEKQNNYAVVSPVEEQETQATASETESVVRNEGRFAYLIARIERVLTIVLSIILLCIVLLIVGASFSASINTMVLHLLRIDIRMEIRYLLQFIQQLASGG